MRRKAYDLAAHLKEVDVDRMLRRITWPKFVEWLGYLQLEPIGEERMDWRFATLCALLANVHRDTKKRWKPYEAKEFLLRFGLPPAPARTQSGKDQFEAWMLILGDHKAVLEQIKKAKARRGAVPPLRPRPARHTNRKGRP